MSILSWEKAGYTDDQSFCSALFEALEGYYTSLRRPDPIITGSYNRAREYASNPELFGLYRGTTYNAGLDIESAKALLGQGGGRKYGVLAGTELPFPGEKTGRT